MSPCYVILAFNLCWLIILFCQIWLLSQLWHEVVKKRLMFAYPNALPSQIKCNTRVHSLLGPCMVWSTWCFCWCSLTPIADEAPSCVLTGAIAALSTHPSPLPHQVWWRYTVLKTLSLYLDFRYLYWWKIFKKNCAWTSLM